MQISLLKLSWTQLTDFVHKPSKNEPLKRKYIKTGRLKKVKLYCKLLLLVFFIIIISHIKRSRCNFVIIIVIIFVVMLVEKKNTN